MLAALTRLGQGPCAVLSLSCPSVIALQQLQWLQQAGFAKGAAKPAAKTKSKASKKTQDPGTSDTDTQKFLLALQPQEIADLDLSSEEQAEAARRSREYGRKKMAQHREWQRDLTNKIRLRDAAIAALPEELRAAAMEPDNEPFPSNRQVWTLTPPIPGYQEEQEAATAAKFAKGGRRR